MAEKVMTTTPWRDGSELGDTLADVEGSLHLLVRHWLADYAFEARTTFIKDPMHKWRASSAMQKAIRQGDVETALRMAQGLWSFDPEYLWRRLPVIAMEDIGVADPALVAAVLWVAGKKQWREQNGGHQKVLYCLVDRLARSVKDRSVCDLVCWVTYCPDMAEKRKAMFVAVEDAKVRFHLMGGLYDPAVFLADRMLAGWALAGTKSHPGENLPEGVAGNMLDVTHAAAGPAVVKAIMTWGSARIRDGMELAYPLIWEMAKKGASPTSDGMSQPVWIEKPVGMPMIGNFPSATFDWHCREGKRSLAYFNAACKPIAEFLTQCGIAPTDKKARVLATSSLLFRVEGSQVDRRLWFEGAEDLYDLAELALNRGCVIKGELNDWGMELMLANMPMMHWSRLKVLDAVPLAGQPTPSNIEVMQQPAEAESDHLAEAPGMTDLMVPPETIGDLDPLPPGHEWKPPQGTLTWKMPDTPVLVAPGIAQFKDGTQVRLAPGSLPAGPGPLSNMALVQVKDPGEPSWHAVYLDPMMAKKVLPVLLSEGGKDLAAMSPETLIDWIAIEGCKPDPAFMQKVVESQHAIDTAATIKAPVSSGAGYVMVGPTTVEAMLKLLHPAPPLPKPKLVLKLKKPGKEGG